MAFLKSTELMEDVIGDLSGPPSRNFKGLKSIAHLELVADIIEEDIACCSSQKFIIDKETVVAMTANQAVSAKNSPNEFLVWSQSDKG